MAKPLEVFKFDRFGHVQEWSMFKKPIRGTRSEQQAYARGFRARVEDYQQDRNDPLSVQFRRKPDETAYWLGYNDARAQERRK